MTAILRVAFTFALPFVVMFIHLIHSQLYKIHRVPDKPHSFTLGLNPSFSANPPYRSLSFFSFRFHYMDSPDCLLYF